MAFIILIIDNTDKEKDISGHHFPSHKWIAVYFPSLLGLICLLIMVLVANILFKEFSDKLTGTPYPFQINKNSITSYPIIQQSVIFLIIIGYISPKVNNQADPFVVKQSIIIKNIYCFWFNITNKIYLKKILFYSIMLHYYLY